MLIHNQKGNYRLIMANINEDHKRSKYQKQTKLFF